MFFLDFHPLKLGKWSNLTCAYFSDGLKPPSSEVFIFFFFKRDLKKILRSVATKTIESQFHLFELGWLSLDCWGCRVVWIGKGYVLATSCMELDSGENCLVLHASLLQPAHAGGWWKRCALAKNQSWRCPGVLESLFHSANVKKSDATWIMPLDKAEKIRKA